jgi:2-C-methyl-D-erythritol 4-phosphate cytidylyltransferase
MNRDIPKQFIHILDKPLIVYTLEAFQRHSDIDALYVVCIRGWEEVLSAFAREYGISKLRGLTPGGATGQESILHGLLVIRRHLDPDDIVVVHDGNRPLISQDMLSDCLVTVKKFGSAVAAIPCQEALLLTDDMLTSNHMGPPREKLARTQTPHAFPLGKLLDAHKRAAAAGITGTVASCTLMLELGESVHFSVGSEKNIKVTTSEDLDLLKAILAAARKEARA